MKTLRETNIGATVKVVRPHREGAIKREMNSRKWTWFAILYQCGFAYVVGFITFQLGKMFAGGVNQVGLVTAFILLAALVFQLLCPYKEAGRVAVR